MFQSTLQCGTKGTKGEILKIYNQILYNSDAILLESQGFFVEWSKAENSRQFERFRSSDANESAQCYIHVE